MRFPIEKLHRIPQPVRVAARTTIWNVGRATAPLRPLPDFLVLGAQKSGTSALYSYLAAHPRVTGPAWKEVSFFDRHWSRGPAWYRGCFPLRHRGCLVGEASPSTILHPLAPERVAEVVPHARLVAILREPGARAYSHYHHEVDLGREPLAFEEALDAEEQRLAGEVERMVADPRAFSHAWWDHSYVLRGRYAEQLERWFAVFPREQLLIVTTEELARDTPGIVARVLEHIGAEPYEAAAYPRVFERAYAPMAEATRRRLDETFAEPNRRLVELLGRDLGW